MKKDFLNFVMTNMSLLEKIEQMIMIDYRNIKVMNSEFEKMLTKYNPGGFILFKSNVVDYDQTKKLINDIKDVTNGKVIVAVDQEGGRVQRLDERVGFERYPSMGELGEINDINKTFELGYKMGLELRNLEIDMNMAPVLDVFSNPKNNVIGDRAFSSDSKIVTKMAISFMDGLKMSGVLAVGKHFPGHGDTEIDSHVDLPILNKTMDELNDLEFVPFVEAIKNKIPGLVIGHIAVPKITKSLIPATLSKLIITDILRDKMNYQGIILTDSLKMKALTKYYDYSDIYINCVLAGNDILVMPLDVGSVIEKIYQGVNDGKITEERINYSVYRILSMKFDRGFFNKEYNVYLKMMEEKEKCILDMKRKILVQK